MRINLPKSATVSMEMTCTGDVYLNMTDDVARLIHDRMKKRYFQEDFLNFLQTQHEDFKISDTSAFQTWNVLWGSYQRHQDMNVAEWDTFEMVLQDVWEQAGQFTCHVCGKKILSITPVADYNGNCYCDECAGTQTDFCEGCGDRHLKSELTYVEDGVGYCEYCKHADE